LRLVLHPRRHLPVSRIAKIANLTAARIYKNRDSVELVVCISCFRSLFIFESGAHCELAHFRHSLS
jgi:hypothetical protein